MRQPRAICMQEWEKSGNRKKTKSNEAIKTSGVCSPPTNDEITPDSILVDGENTRGKVVEI